MGGMMNAWRFGSLRRAVRSWLRRPGFFALATATLALGIAATTVLFAVADHVLLRPLGFPEEDRLVALQGRQVDEPARFGTVSYPEVHDVGRSARSLAATAAVSAWLPGIEPEGGPPVVAPGGTVSWNYFDVLGVEPVIGRGFRASDEGAGRAPVAIVSHDLWLRAFGGDTRVVGRVVPINGTGYEIVGVLPERYRDPRLLTFGAAPPEIWRTPWIDVGEWPRSGRSWRGIGRLADGVGIEAAQEEVRAVMAALADRYPEESRGQTLDVLGIREPVTGPVRSGLLALLAAVGLILAISVLNAAHLVTNRTLDRQTDWQVRRALGAGDARLFGELLAEGLVLATAAGVTGVVLAALGVDAVRGLAAASLPGAEEVRLDPRVIAAVGSVVLGVSVVLGLLPLGRTARRGDLYGEALRGASTLEGGRVRRGLLVAQVSATVILLVGAGLVARSLQSLHGIDLGMDPRGAVIADLHGLGMLDRSEEEAEAVYRDMFGRLGALPGVRAVGAADIVPLESNFSCDGVIPLDRSPPEPGEGLCAEVRSVTPGLLEAIGLTLEQGRTLDWSDGADAPGAMVLSRSAAELFWPGVDVVGRSALVHSDTFNVVGVVGDVRARGPTAAPDPHVYLPAMQEPWNGIARGLSVVVRGSAEQPPSATTVRAAVLAADPREPVQEVRTLSSLFDERIGPFRLRGTLMQVFATLALALSAVGLAAAIGFSVRRRRRELGLRMALGARSGEVTRAAMSDALRWIGVGTLIGLAAALPAGMAARGLLFGVDPWDPAALLAGPLVLACVGLLAAWLPARRAARVDPVAALRPE